MSNILSYAYPFSSNIQRKGNTSDAFLANYSEIEKKSTPCFFYGNLKNPFIVSRCLLALSNTVQSSFNMSPFQIELLKDPIVTAGASKIRFEGFSHCAGVYVRTSILENGHSGEFLANGTTNVDFNQEMISALGGVTRSNNMMLSVGTKEVQISTGGKTIKERKVPLPSKWIKGLTTVQHYLSDSEICFSLNKLQALQLFKTLPKGSVKVDYYLLKRGNRYHFSPMESQHAILIGGIHRLHLITPLLSYIKELKVFAHENMQSVTFQLYFDGVVQQFSFSRNHWRGFSGEGALLEELLEDIPDSLIERMDKYSYVNQEFNSTLLATDENSSFSQIDNLTAKLSAMGLLGFELDTNNFFYRRLPFKLNRILSLNPRLKGVSKLLEEGKVTIIKKEDNLVEATVEGSGVVHTVILSDTDRCTCTWFSRNQGERGPCKHILATKKLISVQN